MENYDSPLSKYKRVPKLYIDLPSKGQYYPKGVLDSDDGTEIPVYSMTASDEIRLKTPDALYTGHAVYDVIKNCVPTIKDPKLMPALDIDYVLSSIRIASYGDTMEITSKCPNEKCEEQSTYSVELQHIIDHYNSLTFKSEIRVEDFLFRIRPLAYFEIQEVQKKTMSIQRQLVQSVSKIEDDDERETQMQALYDALNELQESIVYSIVTEIVTPDGEKEMHQQFIVDFLKNGEPKFFKAVQDVYKEFNSTWNVPVSEVECPSCNKKYSIRPTLDQSNFFGQG